MLSVWLCPRPKTKETMLSPPDAPENQTHMPATGLHGHQNRIISSKNKMTYMYGSIDFRPSSHASLLFLLPANISSAYISHVWTKFARSRQWR